MTATPLQPSLLIPDLLRQAPRARAVLDRYGLKGCGGSEGPRESLGFFARAHDVPLDRLLSELRAALDSGPDSPAAEDSAPSLADAIYRPFFTAGILAVLTAGAAWGAYLLLRIGWGGTFTAVGVHEVNAHGHAQIFGWVGLFVMGFAYQAFPRFKHTALSHPRLAYLSLVLMLAGLAARSVLQPLAPHHPALTVPAVASAGLEVLAVVLFAGIVLATFRASGKPLAVHDGYILASLAWFVVQAIYEAVYLAATLPATGPALIDLVATWQAPLRDLQIHGFAMLMILGVSQRFFHPVYGLPAPNARVSLWALAALNLAVVGEAAGLVLMRRHGHAWAALWYGSVLLLAGAVAVLVAGWRIFSPAPDADRSLKFLRAAYVWLFVSLAALVFLPAYQYVLLPQLAPGSEAARIGFSHAYYGAVRHAITVGFVSLMIVGVAARVVPTLRGVDARTLSPLWVPFLLLNAGCTLRVVAQTATDFTAGAFPVAGVSGLLEVLALALWGGHLLLLMARRQPAFACHSAAGDAPVTAADPVASVLARDPQLLPIFLAHGFRPLANPLARRTLARHVTLGQACRLTGVAVEPFLAALNAARGHRGRLASLPVLN